ncbi:MAG: hypothetical protein RL637_1892 [Pseudomonadota bacterium]
MNAPLNAIFKTDDNLYCGDCLTIMKNIADNSVNLVYLDPPFFTNKTHSLTSPNRKLIYSFDDSWKSHKEYAEFIYLRLIEIKRILKETGSVFIHCDKNANYIIRLVAEDVFGKDNFRSEIIWIYKRWSNSANNLMPNHQTIFFFSKTKNYKFNKTYTDYSATTNVDQLLQKRVRDEDGKVIYAKNNAGEIITADDKKGVPLSDVWEIPFLNPKAKERTGYPTQKPILLLERILQLTTDENDIVLDPFCGSGTTLVAAKLNNRKYIGIDTSTNAIQLAQQRLTDLVKTQSALLENGRCSYLNADEKSLALLAGLDIVIVQRNSGIDALLKKNYLSKPVPIRVQRLQESIAEAMTKLKQAAQKKEAKIAFLIAVHNNTDLFEEIGNLSSDNLIKIIPSTALTINQYMKENNLSTNLY